MAKDTKIRKRDRVEEPVQLQLFQSTGQLNLSAFYETMPKMLLQTAKRLFGKVKT